MNGSNLLQHYTTRLSNEINYRLTCLAEAIAASWQPRDCRKAQHPVVRCR
jgi:hypothetical protein